MRSCNLRKSTDWHSERTFTFALCHAILNPLFNMHLCLQWVHHNVALPKIRPCKRRKKKSMMCSLFATPGHLINKRRWPDPDQTGKRHEVDRLVAFWPGWVSSLPAKSPSFRVCQTGSKSGAPRLKMRAPPQRACQCSCPADAKCGSPECFHLACLHPHSALHT